MEQKTHETEDIKLPFDYDINPKYKNLVRIYFEVKINENSKEMKILY